MKFLVLSVVLSAATAAPSFLGLVGHPNGAVVPVDEPAVAAARADHFAAGGGQAAPVVAAPVVAAAAPMVAAAAPVVAHGYAGPLNLNTHLVGHPNGAVVPADEPAVAAARADHFAAGGGRVHAAPVVAAAVAAARAAHLSTKVAAAPIVAAAVPAVAAAPVV